MSKLFPLIPAIIGTSASLLWVSPSWGMSAVEVAKIAKSATVTIESDVSPGSGVIIQKQGENYVVLTAAHVVKNRTAFYQIVTSEDRRYQIAPQDIKILAGVDLAIVKFRSDRAYRVPKIGNPRNSTEGTTVYVAGFPVSTLTISRSIFNFTDGKVTANSSRPLKDGYALVYSNQTLPGMSGGGVFNDRGELIAIHGKGDVDTRITTSEINPNVRVKTGFNLGIPIDTFMQLASRVGLNFGDGVVANQTSKIARNLPPQADDFILMGFDKAAKNDLQGSIESFTQAIQLNPKLVTARFWRGSYRLLLGDAQGAIADLTNTIQRNPNRLEAYMYRGAAYGKLGQKDKAIADLDRAVSLAPKSAIVYGNRCSLKFQLGDFTGAIADCNQAIAIDPGDPFYYSARGSIYYQLRRHREALADRSTAIVLKPQDGVLYLHRGLSKLSLGDLNGAIADYNTALKLDSRPQIAAEVYVLRAQARYLSKDKSGALADYNQAIQLDRAIPQAYYQRGLLKAEMGDKPGAIADLQTAAKLYQTLKQTQKYQATLKKITELKNN
jgi:tetratricopeptide (TPR) repeat protein/V8-like Glu-specific endopeptidase